MHIGDFDTSSVVYFKFSTVRPSTGAPYTLAGTPALSVYKDNSTTQSTTGVTLTVDFDSVTGLNHVAIDTSADGTFYAAGSFFDVVITTGTVDSVSAVGYVVGRFTLRKNSSLKPTTAGRTLDVSAGGEAGVDWANVGSPTTTVVLSGTTIKTATDVETDTQDIQTRLPAALTGAGNMKADALALSGDTTAADNAESFFDGTGYAGTNNVIPTVTTLTNAPSDSAGVTTLLSRVPSGIFTGMTSLAQWLGLIAGKQTGNSTARTELRATGAGSGTFDETTDSVEALRDRGDAAWATAITLDAAGVRNAVGLSANNLDAQLAAIAGYIDTEIQTLITTIGAGGAGLTAIPWNPTWDAEVQSECADALTAYGGPTNAQMEARTIVAASYATATELAKVIKSGEQRTISRAGQTSITFTETRV